MYFGRITEKRNGELNNMESLSREKGKCNMFQQPEKKCVKYILNLTQ